MGKKGRKTRWRRLPMGGPESAPTTDEVQESKTEPPSPEHRVTFNEDEYTKITTPRQDVLFKKGYLGRRRTTNPSETPEVHSTDSVESSEYIPEEQPQFAYAPPGGYIDQSTGVFYMNSGSYEIYDPYSGNITVVVGPAPQYPPQPILAAMPCQPVPLTPLEWFNPPAPWMCPYNNSNSNCRRKRYSTDSQNCSAQSSESTGPPGSPQESLDAVECAGGPVFTQQPPPPPYMYPGYMFGAPIYNMNGVSVQGVIPQSPVPPSDLSSTKRRKKRRRRRRGGITDEGSESSCEEVLGSCDAGVCSQSGASSDAGQGSSCSKTNSDSGINTEPTPDSGANTPPLPGDDIDRLQQDRHFSTDNCLDDHSGETPLTPTIEETPQSEPEKETETEPISSSVSTPEALKYTLESLPSEDGETLQELSYSSEPSETKFLSCNSELISCEPAEQAATNQASSFTEQDEIEPLNLIESTLESSQNDCSVLSEQTNEPELPSNSSESNILTQTLSIDLLCDNDVTSQPIKLPSSLPEDVSQDVHEVNEDSKNNVTEECRTSRDQEQLPLVILNEDVESIEIKKNMDKEEEEELLVITKGLTIREPVLATLVEGSLLEEASSRSVDDELARSLSRFSSCREVTPPVPPPRRKRSLCRAAEKIATRIVEEAVEEGVKEAANEQCCRQHNLPITEAVTRWLQSQGTAAILTSPTDTDESKSVEDDEEEEDLEVDEGIEDGEGSTNQKNVDGNPFLAPYLSGSRTRVAETDESVSMVSSAGEWDMYDHNRTRAICDPAASVDKYYRLGADDPDEKVATTAPSMIKTAVHIRRAGPFPCGVCCIIQ